MTSKNRFWRDGVLMNDEPVTDIDFIVKHALGTIDRHCNCTGNEMTVIDFKFGKQHDEYDAQVREYMNLLSSMGHHHIKGYLWYVYTNQIKEVTV